MKTKHEKTHAENTKKLLPCTQCDEKFYTQQRLDNHERTRHKDKGKLDNNKVEDLVDLTCHTCNRTFAKKGLLDRHMRTRHKDGLGELICHTCNKTFTQKGHLDRHIIRAHSETGLPRQYKCDQICAETGEACAKTFITKNCLLRHTQTHSPKQFKCKLCEKQLKHPKSIKGHFLKIHELEITSTLTLDQDILTKEGDAVEEEANNDLELKAILLTKV